MIRKIIRTAGWILLTVFMVATLAFSLKESSNIKCSDVVIEVRKSDDIKVPVEELKMLVRNADNKLKGKNLKDIDAEFIENSIKKNRAVADAKVYKIVIKDSIRYKGILAVKIRHRKPVLRVISNDGKNYYIDREGFQFPVSINYAANVLVASGKITDKFAANELLSFVLYIEKDDFWKSQIEQVFVSEKGDVFLTPLVGNHIINLGSLENYRKKLRNLYAFYEQELMNHDWDRYRLINLKFDGLVVTTKR